MAQIEMAYLCHARAPESCSFANQSIFSFLYVFLVHSDYIHHRRLIYIYNMYVYKITFLNLLSLPHSPIALSHGPLPFCPINLLKEKVKLLHVMRLDYREWEKAN